MTEERLKQLQRRLQERRGRAAREAAHKAMWQDRVRGYVQMMLADLGQMSPSPPQDEVVQQMVTAFASYSIDRDLLSVIGPFARGLPEAYRHRLQTHERVRRFREERNRIRAGRLPPMPQGPTDPGPQPEASHAEDKMTENSTGSEPSAAAQRLRQAADQHLALQRSIALNKAKWQADLRLRFEAFMRDMNQSNHPLEEVELAQFLLELAAEQTEDFDLLGLILPFADRLPHALQEQRQNGIVASEFLRISNMTRKYGPTGRPDKNAQSNKPEE